MPVTYAVDQERRIVRAAVSGTVASDEFVSFLEGLAAAGLLAWPRIVDARSARLQITTEDVRRFVFLIDTLRTRHGVSRTAVITDDDATYGMLRMYSALGEAVDPGFAVFRKADDANEWVAPGAPPT